MSIMFKFVTDYPTLALNIYRGIYQELRFAFCHME